MSRGQKQAVPEPQVEAAYYLEPKYASVERFISYFFQIDAVRRTEGRRVLLIGVGDDVVPTYLRKLPDLEVTTLDIDEALHPDVVGDVRSLPFEDGSFDVVGVFEVLEHLPFEEFEKTLRELARVSTGHVLISLPYRHTGFEIVLKFPFIRSILHKPFLRIAATLPLRFPGFEISGQHYWEIGRKPHTRKYIRSVLQKHFILTDEYTSLLDAYRRFYTLRKKNILTNAHARAYYDKHLEGQTQSYTDSRWRSSVVGEFDYNQTHRSLLQTLGTKRFANALEIGPGDGVWTQLIASACDKLTLLEQSQEMYDRVSVFLKEKGLSHVQALHGGFPEDAPSGQYDLVIAVRSFEYFEDKQSAMKKIAELLVPGGVAIIVTKNRTFITTKGKPDRTLHSGQVVYRDMVQYAGGTGLTVQNVIPAVLRWKANMGLFRLFFDTLHWLSVVLNIRALVPFFSDRATESYVYTISKDDH